MTVTVNVSRKTEYYGQPIREHFTVSLDGGDVTKCRLRVLPEGGSKALCVFNRLDIKDLPNEVREQIDEQLYAVPEGLP